MSEVFLWIADKVVDIALQTLKKRKLMKRFYEVCGYETPRDFILDAFSMDGTLDKINEALANGTVTLKEADSYIEIRCKEVFNEEFIDEVEKSGFEFLVDLEERERQKKQRRKKKKKN